MSGSKWNSSSNSALEDRKEYYANNIYAKPLGQRLNNDFMYLTLPMKPIIKSITPASQPMILPLCKLNVNDLWHAFYYNLYHLDDYHLDFHRQASLGKHMFKQFYYHGEKPDKNFHFDLKHGYEKYDEKLQRPLDEGLKSICKYLLLKYAGQRGIPLREAVQYSDFACFRGTLRKLGESFFKTEGKRDKGWKFLVVKYQGVFFIQELSTSANEKMIESERERVHTYYGLKFETYVLADKGKLPNPHLPVATRNSQTNAVFKMIFNPIPSIPKAISVFYSGEIDGLCPEGRHLEVKTRHYGSLINDKVIGWWLQCKLVGIHKILFGLREDGIVKALQDCSLDSLEGIVVGGDSRRRFDFNIALNSIHFFLHEIKQYFNDHLRMNQVLIIERKPYDLNVECSINEANYSQIFSHDFLQFFGPGKR